MCSGDTGWLQGKWGEMADKLKGAGELADKMKEMKGKFEDAAASKVKALRDEKAQTM